VTWRARTSLPTLPLFSCLPLLLLHSQPHCLPTGSCLVGLRRRMSRQRTVPAATIPAFWFVITPTPARGYQIIPRLKTARAAALARAAYCYLWQTSGARSPRYRAALRGRTATAHFGGRQLGRLPPCCLFTRAEQPDLSHAGYGARLFCSRAHRPPASLPSAAYHGLPHYCRACSLRAFCFLRARTPLASLKILLRAGRGWTRGRRERSIRKRCL